MNSGSITGIGIAIGAAIGLATGQWWWIGVGMVIGAAIGASLESAARKNDDGPE